MLFQSLLIIFLISKAESQISNCPTYSCEKLDQKVCGVKKSQSYTLQACPHYFTCDFKQDQTSSCELSHYEYNELAFLGGNCENSFDCLSNKCQDKKCIRTTQDHSCTTNNDCEFGLHCKSQQCIAPALEGDECSFDEDCAWPLGCFKSKCIKYFSIPNMIPGDDANPLFCESGRSYNNICNSITLTGKSTCDSKTTCTYRDIKGNFLLIPNSCVCSISTEPIEVCKQGDENNPYWITALKLLKQSISDELKNKCNAQEKRPGFCRESLRNDWSIRNKNIELSKSLILTDNAHRIDPSIPCSLKSILKFDDTPPQPQTGTFKCPEYHCEKKDKDFIFDDKTCAYSINPFNQQGDKITVELQRLCHEGYNCAYQSSQIYLNWTTNSTCEEIPTQKSWRVKYPGEDCTSHSQCLPGSKGEVRYCIDGICSGDNNDCVEHRDCNKGYFCNGLKCQKQKKENQQCLEQYECYNYLGCLNNTCVKYYSLNNGTYLNKTHPDPRLCKMEKINEETNQCAETDYYQIDAKQKDENGFVECTVGQLCNYTTGYYHKNKPVLITTICQCGFRENGKAYCPIPQSVNQDEWKSLFKYKNKQYDNNCHTLRRSECIEEFCDSNRDELYSYIRKTSNAHLFYKSSNCIIEILSSIMIKPITGYGLIILSLVLL